jgi:hypothetical protein
MLKPLRLSHSTLLLLHSCERKLQLRKLLAGDDDKEESAHLTFGTAYGVGVASYLTYQDQDRALLACWLAYYPELEYKTKSLTKCLAALMASFAHLDSLLDDYELVSFNSKPAVELSFRLNINADYYFVGHIDAILKHRYSGIHVVFECKHTGSNLTDLDPLYKNSGQALGYSIVLDRITGQALSSYGVLYFVAQVGKDYQPKIHTLFYDKTITDRLHWFITLGLDVKHLEEMKELNIYPMRGNSCVAFNRPCMYFGTCQLHAMDRPKEPEPDLVDYSFTYDLGELMRDHIARVGEA